MKKQEIIKYWIDSSDDNYKSMPNMFKAGEYIWSLFIGHLVIEKLLKAYYVKMVGSNVPRTHDLLKLATDADMNLDEAQKDTLQYITLFNIETRYEEYKRDFYMKCNGEFVEKNIRMIEVMRAWLNEKIKK
ncbi:MAG: HEPN domain-containing protein [Dehalococcoidia bacterium]|nr:MAG: HEPN domain-containing protein [Dehalococcoidia bacterium]